MNKNFYKNISWMGLSTITKVVMQLIFMAIMARYITPSDYGVFAIALAIVSFGQILSEAGLGAAVIQKSDLSEKDISTAYYGSIILGFICFIIMCISSNFISKYYDVGILNDIIIVLGLMFIIKSLAVVSESMLMKKMEFKFIAKRDILSFLLSYILIGLPLAFYGVGVWALVTTMIAQETIKAYLVIRRARVRANILDFNLISLKSLSYYTSGVTISGIFNKVATNIDSIIIGKLLGAQVLGSYSRAYQLMAYPANMFGVVISKVFFPTLSKIQNDTKKLREAYYTVVSQMAFILLPFSVCLYFLSNDIVTVLLGFKWSSAVPIFEILSLGVYFRVAYKINGVIARATGHVYKLVLVQLCYAICVTLSCLYGQLGGIELVSILIVVSLIVQFSLKTAIGLYITKMKLYSFVNAHVPGMVAMLLYFISNTFLSGFFETDEAILNIIVGMLLYLISLIISLVIFQGRKEMEIFSRIWNKVQLNAST